MAWPEQVQEQEEEEEEEEEEHEKEKKEGVLLYYNFVSISDTDSLKRWFVSLCSELSLVGRIRIAPDGVNVTVGGKITSLRKHIKAVESYPLLGSCDFKLAFTHSSISSKSSIANEVGFDSLSVRVVKELVTLGVHPSKYPSIKNAGSHLSAIEFHSKIREAEYLLSGSSERNQNLCLPSNRNSESLMIDRFLPHYSDEDQKIAENLVSGDMQNVSGEPKLVLLDVRNIYETRIGRFIPPKGIAFFDPKLRQYSDLPHWIDSNAEKLQDKNILMYCTGGVRCEMASAYIKSKGKGFQNVFQLSGGIQRYLEAFPDGGLFKGKNFVFDYRLAVPSSCTEVVGSCMNCGVAFDDYSSRTRCSYCRMLVLICKSCQAAMPGNQLYKCELCQINKNVTNGSCNDLIDSCSGKAEMTIPQELTIDGVKRLRILCLHGFRQSASSLKGRLASFTKKLKSIAEFVFIDAPHQVPLVFTEARVAETGETITQLNPMLKMPCQKYAWFVTPNMISSSESDVVAQASPTSQTVAGFDKDQYKKQSEGWMASLNKLQQVFSESGPFDGVLGFSQGAAVAFSLCLLRESCLKQENIFKFQFAILCSGFVSPAPEHQELMLTTSLPLKCPSLHVFGEEERCDRQIGIQESKHLASMFTPDNAVLLMHKSGHIVPSQKEYVNQVKSFLTQFIS